MDDPVSTAATFNLKLDIGEDGTQWTRVMSKQGLVSMPAELPTPLRRRLLTFLRQLEGYDVQSMEVGPWMPLGTALINGKMCELPELLSCDPRMHETLHLTAWWMEWYQRKIMAGTRSWACLECNDEVTHKRGHCNNSNCKSWDMLAVITGEAILQPLGASDDA